MAVARRLIVDVDSTPYYLITNRCVRRAFLCGKDHYTGNNYEHRRQLIVDLMMEFTKVFAVDICSFAVMSNHYHLVVRLNPDQAKSWTIKEVLTRWCGPYQGPALVRQYLQSENLTPQQLKEVMVLAETYRERLCDLSWFMAKLNETIARQANKEDKCSGRFWQGRYDARALLDETALITAMMYVDLNPIRARMATTLENSDHTSVQHRIVALAKSLKRSGNKPDAKAQRPTDQRRVTDQALLPFRQEKAASDQLNQVCIPMRLNDYLQLIEWTGQSVRDDKRGAIPAEVTPILEKLNINNTKWLESVTQVENKFGYAFGSIPLLDRFREKISKRWLQGKRVVQAFYRVQPVVNT